jgi:hypothetical protein
MTKDSRLTTNSRGLICFANVSEVAVFLLFVQVDSGARRLVTPAGLRR